MSKPTKICTNCGRGIQEGINQCPNCKSNQIISKQEYKSQTVSGSRYTPEEISKSKTANTKKYLARMKANPPQKPCFQTSTNIPKCPICGSTDLSKITLTHKAGKIALFGIFGMGDNGKTWKCNNCGSKF